MEVTSDGERQAIDPVTQRLCVLFPDRRRDPQRRTKNGGLAGRFLVALPGFRCWVIWGIPGWLGTLCPTRSLAAMMRWFDVCRGGRAGAGGGGPRPVAGPGSGRCAAAGGRRRLPRGLGGVGRCRVRRSARADRGAHGVGVAPRARRGHPGSLDRIRGPGGPGTVVGRRTRPEPRWDLSAEGQLPTTGGAAGRPPRPVDVAPDRQGHHPRVPNPRRPVHPATTAVGVVRRSWDAARRAGPGSRVGRGVAAGGAGLGGPVRGPLDR